MSGGFFHRRDWLHPPIKRYSLSQSRHLIMCSMWQRCVTSMILFRPKAAGRQLVFLPNGERPRPISVSRVTLNVGQPLPVRPDQRTCSASACLKGAPAVISRARFVDKVTWHQQSTTQARHANYSLGAGRKQHSVLAQLSGLLV